MSGSGDPREVARRVLGRVLEQDAFAAAALSSELSRSLLDPRDRALATELVYGVLRTEPYLRRRVTQFGKPKASAEESWLPLLIAVYELDFLDRIPARASINEAVSVVNRELGTQVGGFVNAVLRRVSDHEEARLSKQEAILASVPSWLRKKLFRALGEETASGLLVATERPQPWLRLRSGRAEPSWFSEGTEPDGELLGAYRYVSGGDPRAREEFALGDYVVQEKGSQILGELVKIPESGAVLDVCAGRGMKTLQLAERVHPGQRLVAWDLHEHKLSELREEAARLKLKVETFAWDLTQTPPQELHASFASVLLDAPCTGVGTLRRRPEILRRLGPEEPARMAELQTVLLKNASLLVAPDGTLTYSTCSPLKEECEAVVETLGDAWVPESLSISARFRRESLGSSLRLLPDRDGTDGYFIARFRRRTF